MKTPVLIRELVQALPQGTPFAASMFFETGARATVYQALSRLVSGGEIERVKRGIFVRPRESRFVGKIPPSAQEVAEVVARVSGGALQINGAEAAQRLGLSTQVPTKSVYYTTGKSSRFRVGQLEVTLKHVSPRKMALGAGPAGEALTALWYLGKKQVTPQVIGQIKSRMPADEYDVLKNASALMPAWMAESVRRYEKMHA